ncbi:hypothetical protein ACLOJK_032056 [Asimina triloba]
MAAEPITPSKSISIINVYGNRRWASIIKDPSSCVQIRRPQETHLVSFIHHLHLIRPGSSRSSSRQGRARWASIINDPRSVTPFAHLAGDSYPSMASNAHGQSTI